MAKRAIDIGFGPDQPTPQEVESLSTRAAILRGVRDGISQAALAQANQAIQGPMGLADELVGALIEPANDGVAYAQQIRDALSAEAAQHALNAIQGPLRTGIALGYSPQGTRLLSDPRARKRRSRKKGAPESETLAQPRDMTAVNPVVQAPDTAGVLASGFPTAEPGSLLVGGGGNARPSIVTQAPTEPGAGGIPGTPGGTALPPGTIFPGLPPIEVPPGMQFPPLQPPVKPPILIKPLPPPQQPPGGAAPILPQPVQPAPPETKCCEGPPVIVQPPKCPQCGGVIVPILLPGPPPPNITLSCPACPSCGTEQPPIVIGGGISSTGPVGGNVGAASGASGTTTTTPGGGTAGTVAGPTLPIGTAPAPPAQPPGTAPGQQGTCPTCSIDWLTLNYPDFVLAQRAAEHTDFDILSAAVKLQICCLNTPLQMPACSMPFLAREVPAFVAAGQAEGLSDDEILQSAFDVGLCAYAPPQLKLGEEAVTLIAPGSAEQLAAEFDPSAAGEAPRPSYIPVTTDATEFCWQVFALPGPDDVPVSFGTAGANCLIGWERAAWGILSALATQIEKAANCESGGISNALGEAGASLWNMNTWWGKILGQGLRALGWFNRELAVNAVQVENWISAVTGCGAGETGPAIMAGLVIGAIQKWVLELPAPLAQAMRTTQNMACPTQTPSGAEVNALRTEGLISVPDWECVHRREGNILSYQEMIAKAQQQTIDTDDIIDALSRKIINEDQALALFRRAGWRLKFPDGSDTAPDLGDENVNGYTIDERLEIRRKLAEFLPTPTEAVQWMIKDVADPLIQETFLLDAEFKQKYRGRVKEVFDANRFRREDAENTWRAHWRNMAPHQLYELHKRLRPGWTNLMPDAEVTHLVEAICPRKPNIQGVDPLAGRPESNGFPVPTYCEELTDATRQRQWLESLTTTGYHVSEGLGQDDYPAFWRQRLLAISYRVVTRVDARRAYETSQINQERLESIFQDQGYSPGDSHILAGFYKVAAEQLHSRRPVCNQWIKDGYDPQLLKTALITQGMRPDMWDDVYANVKARRAIAIQVECIRGIKNRYMKYLIRTDQAAQQLEDLKLDGVRVVELLNEWDCIRAQTTKQETATEICGMFKAGIITGREALDAIKRSGYTAQQATKILSLCYLKPMPKGLKSMPKPGTPEFTAMQEALGTTLG